MRIRWLVAVAAVLALGAAASAQPAGAKPTVEVRLRSVNDLVGKAEYLAGLAGQDEVVKQFTQIIKQLSADGKGLEGVDTKQPFGLYASLTADVINSPVTIMVPVADKDRFLQMLGDRLQLNPKKDEDGLYKVEVPVINELFIRFANDYAYIGRSPKGLDAKTLPAPKTFFAADDKAVGSLVVRFDQIPDDLKKFIIGQIELGIAEQRRKNEGNENPAEKAIVDWATENVTGGLKTLLDDAKELNVRVFIDEKADDLSAELTLTAKSGSTLAKNIGSLAGKTSVPAAIVGDKNAAVRATAKGSLPDGVKKDLPKVVDSAIAEILKGVGEQEKPIVEKILNTIAPTLKAGDLDVAFALTGPDAKGRYAVVAAGQVKKGKDVEKLVKDLAAQFGPMAGDAIKFDFDVEKIGDFNLHSVTINGAPPEVEKIFGGKKVWVAFSDEYVALSVEPDGAALKAGLKAKAVPVPAASLEVSAARLLPLLGQKLQPDEVKAILKDAFGDGDPTGKDTLSVTVTGGDQLTVKGKLKGKAVRLVVGMLQLQGK
jgi:hypothetical protein